MRNLLAIFLTVGLFPTCAIFATEIDPEADFYSSRLLTEREMEFDRLKEVGVSIAYPVKDEPWKQRRFGLFDSAGMWVDVV